MRRMLISRISRRVLAEHHIALSNDLESKRYGESSNRPDHVGIIYTGLKAKDSIELCTSYLRNRPFDVDDDGGNTTADWPQVIVDGHVDTEFPYIKEHLE